MKKKERALAFIQTLKDRYPEASCALRYEGDPWRLLVMGRLSAQCTDARVNQVSPNLFAKYPTARDMAGADLRELEELVRPCGLYRIKAENIRDASRILVDKYDGTLPDTMEELLTLPGVGRKIANLLLGDIYHKSAIVTDTHCIRICGRVGLYPETLKEPYAVEKALMPLLPPEESSDFCHRVVFFGREVCMARNPDCAHCPAASYCLHNLKQKK